MGKKIAILQSSYIPWKGYFDIIHDVDLFIFYDEVQYTVRDWRSRNRIYGRQGLSWLSVPCGSNTRRSISEVKIRSDLPWGLEHWNKIRNDYRNTPHFGEYESFFRDVYLDRQWEYLSALNQYLTREISRFLGITTPFADSTDFASSGRKTEKLLTICQSAGCSAYLSGPAAKDYLDEEAFREAGIEVIWKDYSGYPEYEQESVPFEHGVSVIDMLFHLGARTPAYIWGWRENTS